MKSDHTKIYIISTFMYLNGYTVVYLCGFAAAAARTATLCMQILRQIEICTTLFGSVVQTFES